MKRKTVQRDAIREVFLNRNQPLRMEEIVRTGRNIVRTLNQATVYRNLKVLLEEGWITSFHHPVLGTLYERAEKDHHHHFHCRSCDRLYEIEGCALNEEKLTPSGFLTEDHEVFLFGVCPSCQRNDK